MPRNPSELARLEEELADLKDNFRKMRYRDRETKQKALTEMCFVAGQLGLYVPPYNSTEFINWIGK